MNKIRNIVCGLLLLFATSMSIAPVVNAEVTNDLKINYVLDGGKTTNPTSYTANEIVTLTNATKVGYTFDGWYKESEFKTKVSTIENESTDITLYAKWTANKYTIQFHGNGYTSGSMSKLSSRVYGTTYTLPNNAFKRTGYTFIGWNTKKDGTGVSIANKQNVRNLTVKNGGVVTLYAQWTPTKYTISYKVQGGTHNNPATYTMNSSTITLTAPTKNGYTFKGWYTDSAYKNQVIGIKAGSTGNKTLYAKYYANTYNVQFNPNGATSGTMNKMIKLKYGTRYSIASNTFKRTGYTFVGWNTRKDGSGKAIKNAGSFISLTATQGKTVTLYAQWKPVNYRIGYNLNDGKNNSANPTNYNITTANIVLKNPTRAGYIFAGWFTNRNYNKRVTTINKGTTGNITLYAKWIVSKPAIASWTPVQYDSVTINIKTVSNADGYTVYRSKSKTSGFKEIGSTTASSYTDSKLTASTVYYYKVSAYVLDSKGNKMYTNPSDARYVKTTQKPQVAGYVANQSGTTSRYGILHVKNKGNKRLYIGGTNVTNFGLVYPYEGASYTKGTLEASDGSTVSAIYVDPKESGYVYFRMNTSRPFGAGAKISFFFEYDGCLYTAVVDDDGNGIYA